MKLVIGGIVAVIIAAGLWMSMRPVSPASTTPAHETTKIDSSTSGTLASLFGMGGSMRCTVRSQSADGMGNGIVHVLNGDVYGEFDTTSDTGTMKAYLVKTGSHVYAWSSAMPMGVKMSATTLESESTPEAAAQFVDTGVAVDYSCEQAPIDTSLFTPPAHVQFMDMTQGVPDPAQFMKMMQ